MLSPDITYRYMSPKDVSGPTVEIFSRDDFVTANLASVTAQVTGVAKDKVLILSSATFNGVPGAAITLDRLRITGFTHAGRAFNIWDSFPQRAAGIQSAGNWQGEIWVLGRGADENVLQVTALFSGADPANSAGLGMSGALIPRANVGVF